MPGGQQIVEISEYSVDQLQKPVRPDKRSNLRRAELKQREEDGRCWVCGGPVIEHHCKIVCQVCGFTRDCSDP
jgi:hypothetical protein